MVWEKLKLLIIPNKFCYYCCLTFLWHSAAADDDDDGPSMPPQLHGREFDAVGPRSWWRELQYEIVGASSKRGKPKLVDSVGISTHWSTKAATSPRGRAVSATRTSPAEPVWGSMETISGGTVQTTRTRPFQETTWRIVWVPKWKLLPCSSQPHNWWRTRSWRRMSTRQGNRWMQSHVHNTWSGMTITDEGTVRLTRPICTSN